ncbi:hypothetical protein DOM21_07165 [Bacteriovorax stolpii]|uniref:ATP-binding protein n=1 Tax=Bacteriovorax stolpii TaxID=960 RepID=UPI00115706DD|nr:ATP-binding protein [Bacteriovorax stolpii]QDK41239.1 hypothetical protein DOM21_07165 [Bacteriovorax stolpii]
MSKLKMELSPANMFLSIRGIQYAFHEAIADIVDNSVDAGATIIWVTANKSEIIIADDGEGMTSAELETAITPWKAGQKDLKMRRGKRGKFGIGMKSASYSLGDCLEIHTKAEDSIFEFIELDRDKIAKYTKPDHLFDTINTPTELFKSYCKNSTGTVLRITKVNKRKVTNTAVEQLSNLLGLVYFEPLENGELKILINNQPVKGLDPLMRKLKKNQSKNYYELFEKKTITVSNEDSGEKAIFKIQAAYVGRGNFWTEEDKKNYKYFFKRNPTDEDTLKRGLLKLDEQGLYIKRNGRLITLGGWHGIASTNSLMHHNTSTRVMIEFDEAGDAMMGLDNTKTQLKIEEALKEKLGSYVRDIVNKGDELFRDEGKVLGVLRQKEKGSDDIVVKNLKKDEAIKQYQLEKQRERTIPEYDEKQKKLKTEQEQDAILTTQLVEIKEKLPNNNLWSFEINKDGEVLLLYNEDHPGYQALFLEDDILKLNKNLNYFFYTLASHEASIRELHKELKPAMLDDLEKAFKTFRRWVSKHYTEF